ncbi:hypothetical protein ACCT28_23040 [Rhizobium ruizarguesonis]
MRENRLFAKVEWHRQVQAQFQGLEKKTQDLPAAKMASATDEEIVAELVEECRLDIPVIDENEITVSSREVTLDGRKGLSISVRVPFQGDQDLFHVQPPTYGGNLPNGNISGKFITFEVIGTDFEQHSPKPQIDRNISAIQQNLEWQRQALGDFPSRLAAEAVRAVQARRKNLAGNASVIDQLGYKKG